MHPDDSKRKTKTNLPEFDDESPLSLGEHYEKRYQHCVTPEYAVENLEPTTRHDV